MAAMATSREPWCMLLWRYSIRSTSQWRAFMAPLMLISRTRLNSIRVPASLGAGAVVAGTATRRSAATRLSLGGWRAAPLHRRSGHGSDHGGIGSGAISSGDNHAGNGGDGYFYGSLVHTSFALYDPINIAVAGYNSSAHADQSNNVEFDQSAFQMAGVGGNGGSGNAAIGG